jgi:PAS domain S-box-containing protein
VRACRDLLRRSFEAANRIGDLTFGAYACYNLNSDLLFAGEPLPDAEREAEHGLKFAAKARFGLVTDFITTQLALIRMLRGLTPKFGCFDDGQFSELRIEDHLSNPALAVAACLYWIRKLQARYVAGDYATAFDAASKAQPLLWTSSSLFEEAEYHFYGALARAAYCDSAAAGEREQLLDALARHHKQLQVWAENCPENFENRTALLGAEIARLEGRELDAMRLYEQAIRSAQANGFVHNEGLANELASRFYAARGLEKMARVYLQDARYCYIRWGADGKVRQLEEMHPHLRTENAAPGPTNTIATSVEHLDLATVIKVSQAISGEIALEKLTDTLLRTAVAHAGAARGLLILARGDGLRIQAEAITNSSSVSIRLQDVPISNAELPETVLRYATHTRENIILEDASGRGPFSDDDYIRRTRARSILCLPLVRRGKLIALLYLENNLAVGVFTPSRLAVLTVIASQAAISLQNGELYRELRQNEAYLAEAQKLSQTGSFGWHVSSGEIYWSEETFRIFDYDPASQSTFQRVFERIHPEDRIFVRQILDSAVQEVKNFDFEHRLMMSDGSVKYVRVVGRPSAKGESDALEFVGAVTDITNRKRAEEALRRSERELRHVIETIPTMAWTALPDGTNEFANQSWLDYTGISLKDTSGTGWKAVFHPADIAAHVDKWRESVGKGSVFENEARIRRIRDGEYRWFLIRGIPLRDDSGNILKWYGISTDIDDHKRAEEALRKSEERWRSVFENSAIGVVLADMNGRFLVANHAYQTMVGYTDEELRALSFLDVTHEDHHEANWALINELVEGRRRQFQIEKKYRRKDGSLIWVSNNVSLVPGTERLPRFFMVLSEDITDRKRAEEERERLRQLEAELAHMNRVSTMGELAASLAHEIKQPLSGVVVNANACLRWLADDSPNLVEARENARRIARDGKRAGDITSRIQALAEKTATAMAPLDINEAIQEVIMLAQPEVARNNVTLQAKFADGLSPVLGDRVQLQQVVLNLVMNAVEAMSTVGDRPRELAIRTQNDEADLVRITVKDSGTGLDPQAMERIFDAFYTTKSGGMGMGLSICRSIVRNHGGRLWAVANDGPGTTFQFTVPKYDIAARNSVA